MESKNGQKYQSCSNRLSGHVKCRSFYSFCFETLKKPTPVLGRFVFGRMSEFCDQNAQNADHQYGIDEQAQNTGGVGDPLDPENRRDDPALFVVIIEPQNCVHKGGYDGEYLNCCENWKKGRKYVENNEISNLQENMFKIINYVEIR